MDLYVHVLRYLIPSINLKLMGTRQHITRKQVGLCVDIAFITCPKKKKTFMTEISTSCGLLLADDSSLSSPLPLFHPVARCRTGSWPSWGCWHWCCNHLRASIFRRLIRAAFSRIFHLQIYNLQFPRFCPWCHFLEWSDSGLYGCPGSNRPTRFSWRIVPSE